MTTITIRPVQNGDPTAHYKEVRYVDRDGSLVVETTMDGRPNKRTAVYTRAPK